MKLRIVVLMGVILGLFACSAVPSLAGVTPTAPAEKITSGSTPTQPPPPPATPTPSPIPQPSQTPAGTWISFSPDSAAAGALIQIQGYLPGGPTAADAQNNLQFQAARVCWGGCAAGLIYNNQPVIWSTDKAGVFTIPFTLPQTGWLAPAGVSELKSGDYTLEVGCLAAPDYNCANQPAQASAVFHLDASKVQPQVPGLAFDPPQAPPGKTVHVTGWAPVAEIFSGQAVGYGLYLIPQGQPDQAQNLGMLAQTLSGELDGKFIVPLQSGQSKLTPGAYTLGVQTSLPQDQYKASPMLAETPFEISAALQWKDLNPGVPQRISPALSVADPLLAVDPTLPGRVAYCQPGNLRVTADAGKTWRSIPVAGVTAAAEKVGYQLQAGPSNPAECLWPALDSLHPDSFFAAFRTANPQYGAPPEFFMGFYTADAGKTWAAAPLPAPGLQELFGGFYSDGQRVQALFSLPSGGTTPPPPVKVMETTDGGATWTQANAVCPAGQSCLRWGPGAGQISGMGSPAPQWVIHSADNGANWQEMGSPIEMRMSGPSQLAVFDGGQAFIISGGADFPLLYTGDSGAAWQAVELPAFTEFEASVTSGLQMLPDGSLVTLIGAEWWRLPPASAAWCRLSGLTLPAQPVLLQRSGERLWWFPDPYSSPMPPPVSGGFAGAGCKP